MGQASSDVIPPLQQQTPARQALVSSSLLFLSSDFEDDAVNLLGR